VDPGEIAADLALRTEFGTPIFDHFLIAQNPTGTSWKQGEEYLG
jgi:hypothetical protein